jgi:hypothetical protein
MLGYNIFKKKKEEAPKEPANTEVPPPAPQEQK